MKVKIPENTKTESKKNSSTFSMIGVVGPRGVVEGGGWGREGRKGEGERGGGLGGEGKGKGMGRGREEERGRGGGGGGRGKGSGGEGGKGKRS